MKSVKESLHSLIELLNEEEADQVLKLVEKYQERRGISPTLRRLAKDPTFKIPANLAEPFDIIEPAPLVGCPAL